LKTKFFIKFTAEEFFYQKLQFYLFLGLHKGRPGEAFSPQKTTSSTSKHEILKFLWVIFALLDPDPESGSGYRSTDLIESGSRSETHEVFYSEHEP
jgi:hypothetical protein